jgi:hypothetical protein
MLHMCMKMSTLPRVCMNSQNRIQLYKIGQKDRNFPISTSNFVQLDPILAVRVNRGLSSHRCLILSGVEQHLNRH